MIAFKFGTPIRHSVAYLSLKFRDVSAESKGVMHDNIAKKPSKSLVIPTGKNHWSYGLQISSTYCFFIKCYGLEIFFQNYATIKKLTV